MSFALIQKVNDEQKKAQVVDVRSGDTVRVYQKIKEGNKERIQMFEGVVLEVAHAAHQHLMLDIVIDAREDRARQQAICFAAQPIEDRKSVV